MREVKARGRLPRILRWDLAAGVVTFGVQLLQVRWWAAKMPMSDEWSLLRLFGRASDGGARLSMLWEQHNEHRETLANLVFLTTRRLGGWVVLAPALLSALVIAFTVAFLVNTLLRLQVRSSLVFVAVTFALTPLQWENTIWPFQIQFFGLVAGAVLLACALARRPVLDRRTVLIVVGAALWCTGTIVSGLLIWGVGTGACALLTIAGRTVWSARRSWLVVGGIAALGFAVTALYAIGYRAPNRIGNGGPANQVRWTLRAIVYPFAGPGGQSGVTRLLPLGVIGGAAVGAALLCVIAFALVDGWRLRSDDLTMGRVMFVAVTVGWVLAQVAVIGFGRAGGVEIASRYGSLLTWLPAAAMVAVDHLLRRTSIGSERTPRLHHGAPIAMAALVGLAVVQHAGAVRDVPAQATGWASRANLDTTMDFFGRGMTGSVAAPLPYAEEAAFATILRDASEHGWLGQLPQDVQSVLQWRPTATGNAWSIGGAHPSVHAANGTWGSWSGSDDNTGVLLSQPFTTHDRTLTLAVYGGPDRPGNRIELVDANTGDVVATLHGPAPQGRRAIWRATIDGRLPRQLRVRATDDARGYLGWFAIEAPVSKSTLRLATDAALSDAPGIALLGIGLSCMVALARPRRDDALPPATLRS